jgi:hypothetical protein
VSEFENQVELLQNKLKKLLNNTKNKLLNLLLESKELKKMKKKLKLMICF